MNVLRRGRRPQLESGCARRYPPRRYSLRRSTLSLALPRISRLTSGPRAPPKPMDRPQYSGCSETMQKCQAARDPARDLNQPDWATKSFEAWEGRPVHQRRHSAPARSSRPALLPAWCRASSCFSVRRRLIARAVSRPRQTCQVRCACAVEMSYEGPSLTAAMDCPQPYRWPSVEQTKRFGSVRQPFSDHLCTFLAKPDADQMGSSCRKALNSSAMEKCRWNRWAALRSARQLLPSR